MIALAFLETRGGAVTRVIDLGSEALPSKLRESATVVLDNTDLVLPEIDCRVFMISRHQISEGTYTWIGVYRPIRGRQRTREGMLFAVGIWLRGTRFRDGRVVEILQTISDRFDDALHSRSDSFFDLRRMRLGDMVSDHELAELNASEIRANEYAIKEAELPTVFFLSGSERDVVTAQILQILDRSEYAFLTRAIVSDDPVIAATVRRTKSRDRIMERGNEEFSVTTAYPISHTTSERSSSPSTALRAITPAETAARVENIRSKLAEVSETVRINEATGRETAATLGNWINRQRRRNTIVALAFAGTAAVLSCFTYTVWSLTEDLQQVQISARIGLQRPTSPVPTPIPIPADVDQKAPTTPALSPLDGKEAQQSWSCVFDGPDAKQLHDTVAALRNETDLYLKSAKKERTVENFARVTELIRQLGDLDARKCASPSPNGALRRLDVPLPVAK